VLRVGRYRLLQSLGSGGAANVYLAEDTRLGRKVALKILNREANQHELEALEHEARCASMLAHANIVTLFDFGVSNGTPYLVTEYIEGTNLRDRLERGPLPLPEALDIAIAVGGALATAHEAWIVHRDIKPENIMLRRDRAVKVLDFGVAALTRANAPADPLRPTTSGMIVGTLQYLSPEQVRGDAIIDSRSDLFSLGIVLYEMLSGATPFHGPSTMDLLAAIVEKEPAPLSDHLPVAVHRIVAKALRKPIHERYQLAGDFVEELTNLRLDLVLSERAARAV
ncbi:MAG TPA: serine/threonine-protein kinase, partial [Thermoanaerobaculia bacterium]|nr:serine/threonine-protein kinase [Thermoanaerobaculia bacterium]